MADPAGTRHPTRHCPWRRMLGRLRAVVLCVCLAAILGIAAADVPPLTQGNDDGTPFQAMVVPAPSKVSDSGGYTLSAECALHVLCAGFVAAVSFQSDLWDPRSIERSAEVETCCGRAITPSSPPPKSIRRA